MNDEPSDFEKELSALLNRHGIDAATNTPDYLLAEFLLRQLQAYRLLVTKNAEWHGWQIGVGNG